MICATCSRHAEVDIDIGHRHTLGIEKPLEEQRVLQRIDVGDLHHICDERACSGAATRADRNIVLARVANEVPHNEEVARELHLLDTFEFALQPRLVVRDRLAQQALVLQVAHAGVETLAETLAAHLLKVALDRVPVRNGKLRERVLDLVELELAALRKLHRPAYDLGCI
jgi:hypothetical protein